VRFGAMWHKLAMAVGPSTALATGLATKAPHLRCAAVVLNPNLREKRNFGGKDSSGKWISDALREGVHDALRTLYADSPDIVEKLVGVELDLASVRNKWWLGSAESEGHVVDRIDDMLNQVHFNTSKSVVLVGHSHYFREVMRHFRAEACALSDSGGESLDPTQLKSKKLSNAGVIKCELDFSQAKPLVSVQLLFATSLID